ncbi:MAG: class D sortase [Clostridiales Family XIII bacterium]|jgi:LPXTG-site transpeptidase (sortase) family protein|nr:class D sortase [Clostridiales Family XIII bacterium]
MKKIAAAMLIGAIAFVCASADASAADYTFLAKSKDDFYKSTLYEDMYGSAYNCGGPNVTDFADTAALLPGILSASPVSGGASPAVTVLPGYDGAAYSSETADGFVSGLSYTPASELLRSDGSLGTLEIPSLAISVRVYEGTDAEALRKGVGHFPDSSAWFGNVCIAGHNRGAKYNIGEIRDLKIGDIVTYGTSLGTRRCAVSFVGTISAADLSYLSATRDNRITLITCLADRPELRVVVQANEIH